MKKEDNQLLAIQNDLCARLRARDQARELLAPTVKGAQAKVKLADKMLMLPSHIMKD